MDIREEVLMESLGYKGDNFWENYFLSNLVRTVSKDLKESGPEYTISIYEDLYGSGMREILEFMVEEEESLHEVAKVQGTLLFESIGNENLHKYLNEMSAATYTRINNKLKTIKPKIPSREAVAAAKNVLDPGDLSIKAGAKAINIAKPGFLSGLWAKFRGTGIGKSILPFLKKNFGWAKDLVTKGVGWLAQYPLAQSAVYLLLLTGSVKIVKKIINKMRKKKKMKPLSPEEETKIVDIAREKKSSIENTRGKVLGINGTVRLN